MRRRGVSGRVSSVLILFVLTVFVSFMALSEVRMPEASGKDVKKNGDLVIDCSHMDQGYVMVKSKKTNKRLKVRVKTADTSLNYDLNNEGDYEVFPLQFGSGKYQVALYKNASGKKYSEEGKVNLTVKMPDPNACFLYPNQYVNYDENTPCVIKAAEICEGMTDQAEIYETVRRFVLKNFNYDYVKSVTVKAGVLPDINGCWEKRMGICQDLSALTIAMLRSQGIPARLMIGTLGASTYHAWVTAVVNGEDKFFDPTAELSGSSKTATYTTERYY